MGTHKPAIDETSFGSITLEGVAFRHDIIVTLDGKVKKRKKKLSKEVYGTSHTISLAEIAHVYEENAEGIVIGSGQYGVAALSEEAKTFLSEKNCKVVIEPTPQAVIQWNRISGKWIGLFHITC
jgi:hypothetical protein